MTKKYKIILGGILGIMLVSLYFSYNPSTNTELFPKCPFYGISGLHCPGCGSQRAIHDLVHLRFLDAIGHNLLLIVTLVFGGGLYLYSKTKFYNLMYHPKSPYIIFSIVILFWVLRNLDISPFHYLAP